MGELARRRRMALALHLTKVQHKTHNTLSCKWHVVLFFCVYADLLSLCAGFDS